MRKKTAATGIDIFWGNNLVDHHDSYISASQKYFPEHAYTYLCTMIHANTKRGKKDYTDNRGYRFVKTKGKMTIQKPFKIFDKSNNTYFTVETLTKLLEKTKVNQRKLYKDLEIYGNYDDSKYTIWRA